MPRVKFNLEYKTSDIVSELDGSFSDFFAYRTPLRSGATLTLNGWYRREPEWVNLAVTCLSRFGQDPAEADAAV